MTIFILILFISIILVLVAVVQFVFIVKNRDMNFSDQMSILPLEEDKKSKRYDHS